MEALEVVGLAQQKGGVPGLVLREVHKSNLTLAVGALGAGLVEEGAVEVHLRVHGIDGLGADLALGGHDIDR